MSQTVFSQMSVFGGDNWGREASHRKRRIDDLLLDGIGIDTSSSCKKLASGKYACLVCPHDPILDTPLMLSMHIKGSRHCAAESRHKERELARQNDINKRIALSKDRVTPAKTGISTQVRRLASKPLIEHTTQAVSETLSSKSSQPCPKYGTQIVKSTRNHITNGPSSNNDPIVEVGGAGKEVLMRQFDYQERREKELKFTAAGWKRDGFGGWYRDENVEYDSDEEDPNVSLA